MFDVDVYLARLGYTGPVSPTWPVLRDLHKRHLMTIPYDSALNATRGDNLWSNVDIDVDKTFAEVVVGGRGGVCTELNGLFRVLLERLGFTVDVYSAGTRQLDGSFGPDLEHVFNSVVLDGTRYLVDVGFVGPSFLEPIVLSDEPQEQYGNVFRVVRDGGYRVLLRKGRRGTTSRRTASARVPARSTNGTTPATTCGSSPAVWPRREPWCAAVLSRPASAS